MINPHGIVLLAAQVCSWIISIYLLILLVRAVLEWIRFFVPQMRPPGVLLVIANIVYALTDPPLRALRRVIPPARLGSVSLDVGFIVLFFGLMILRRVIWYLAYLLM
ncbi:YggT family protein [Nanchangia anserum]|uniref:YggT family protein n=1 Tax=Nanchangia anserum TaxID=2692125 RepID=UPI001CC6710A|nr:YggT family protein [Nanchangia anserum]